MAKEPVTKIQVRDQVEDMIPHEDTPPEVTEEVEKVVEAAGGVPKAMDPAVAEVLANMQGEIARLNRELQGTQARQKEDESNAGPGGYPWQYYKRPTITDPRHGSYAASDWIVIAPGGAAAGGRRNSGAFTFYSAKGFKPLMNYGVAGVPKVQRNPGAEYADFINRGGAKEFPVSQILALKWHHDPPVPGTVFPQYEEVKDKVKSFLCDECEFELYFLPEDEQSPQAVFRHLKVGHDYSRQEAAMALQVQGIKNVAPFAIRAAAANIQEPEDALANYPDVKKVDED